MCAKMTKVWTGALAATLHASGQTKTPPWLFAISLSSEVERPHVVNAACEIEGKT